jgi:hypothetical protein
VALPFLGQPTSLIVQRYTWTADPKRLCLTHLTLRPFEFSAGPDLWCRPSPVTACLLTILNKSDAVQSSPPACKRHIEHGQAIIIPSPNHPHFVTQQKPYPGPAAMQTQGGHAQYSKPTNNHSGSSPIIGYESPSSSSSSCSLRNLFRLVFSLFLWS